MRPVARSVAVATLRDLDAMLARLPDDCEWFLATWAEVDPASLRHVYSEDWAAASGGTGRVETTARAILDGGAASVAERVRAIATAFDAALCGAFLLGANDLETGPFVIMDGNHRATAIAVRRLMNDPVALPDAPVVVARSTSRPIWNWEG